MIDTMKRPELMKLAKKLGVNPKLKNDELKVEISMEMERLESIVEVALAPKSKIVATKAKSTGFKGYHPITGDPVA